MARDYYETLGISREATDVEIKKAYRQLAMQHHPDRNPGDKAAEDRFKEVNEAYAVLSDPDKRAHYDRFGTVASAGGFADSGFGTLFEDIFDNFFGTGGGGRRTRTVRGEDLQYELKITLEEAAGGVESKIRIPRLERCETCGGAGNEPGTERRTCEMCRGRGEVRMSHGFLTVARTCPKCGGEGASRTPCKACRGDGRVRHERLLQVQIPAGIDDGMQMRLSGEGSTGPNGGPPGDLYVLVRVAQHETFTRKDDDLYADVPITFPQLALGTELEVPTLSGTAKIKVPKGTQPQHVVRLRGKGMPRLRERGQGDACYRLILEVPHDLNAKQVEALRAFDAASKGQHGPLATAFFDRMKKLLG